MEDAWGRVLDGPRQPLARTMHHHDGPGPETTALMRRHKTPVQATRGGGASGAARTQEKTTSPDRIASARGVMDATATTTGGGGAPPIDSHWATMPPQASIERSVTPLRETGSLGVSVGGGSTGQHASAATAEQHAG